jgi:Uma2 family endonuclease
MGKPARYPRADEVAIVIEAADVSLAVDRTVKAGIYARAGIPVYWLVNVIDRQVELHLNPCDGRYTSVAIATSGQSLPVVVAGQPVGAIQVADLFP